MENNAAKGNMEYKGCGRGNELVLIEKYDEFIEYIYPVLQGVARRHGIVKEDTMKLIFNQVDLFYKAIKSNHVSKLYEADGGLASIRHRLRFLASPKRRLISQKQHQYASIKLAEVGKMLGSIIQNKGQSRNCGDIGR